MPGVPNMKHPPEPMQNLNTGDSHQYHRDPQWYDSGPSHKDIAWHIKCCEGSSHYLAPIIITLLAIPICQLAQEGNQESLSDAQLSTRT